MILPIFRGKVNDLTLWPRVDRLPRHIVSPQSPTGGSSYSRCARSSATTLVCNATFDWSRTDVAIRVLSTQLSECVQEVIIVSIHVSLCHTFWRCM